MDRGLPGRRGPWTAGRWAAGPLGRWAAGPPSGRWAVSGRGPAFSKTLVGDD